MKKLLMSLVLLLSITNCALANFAQVKQQFNELQTFTRDPQLRGENPLYSSLVSKEKRAETKRRLAEFAEAFNELSPNEKAKLRSKVENFLIDLVIKPKATVYYDPFKPEIAEEVLLKFRGLEKADKEFLNRLNTMNEDAQAEINSGKRSARSEIGIEYWIRERRKIIQRFEQTRATEKQNEPNPADQQEENLLQPNDRALLEDYKRLTEENPGAQFNDESRKKARNILQQLFENALKQTDPEEYLASINDELPKVRAVGEDKALVMGSLVAQQPTTKDQLQLTETLTEAMPKIATREGAQPFEAAVIQKFLMSNDIKGLSRFMEQLPDNSPFKRGIQDGVPSVVKEALRQITQSVERGLSKDLTKDMLDTLTLNKAIEELGLSTDLYRSSANAMQAIAKENVKNKPSSEANAALEKIDKFIKTFEESFDKPKTWGDKLSDFGTTLRRLLWTKGARGILKEQKQIKEIVTAMRQNRTEFGKKVDAFIEDAFKGKEPDYRAIGNLLNELYKRSASEQVIDRVLQSVVEKAGSAFDTPDKRHEALLKILNEVKETGNLKERIKDAFYKEIRRNYQDTTVDPARILGADGHETAAQQKAAAEKAEQEAKEQGKEAGKTGENITDKSGHTRSTGVENHEHAAPVTTSGQDGKGGSSSQKHSGPQEAQPTPTNGLTPEQIKQQKEEEARQKAAEQGGDGVDQTNSGGDEPHAA